MKKIYLLFASLFMLGAIQSTAQCSADFMFSTNGLSVTFIDSSIYSPNLVQPLQQDWNFGDNSTGVGTNPSHTYAVAGTYNVLLTIYDSTFSCFDTINKAVTVTGGANPTPCNASYTYNVNPNNSVNFTSSITGGTAPFTYVWDFGDGSSNTTGVQNPSHTYSNTGVYVTTLTVTGANNSTCSYSDTVAVNTCTANFSSQVGSNGSVNFTNLSNPINNRVVFYWNFGDGSPLVFSTNATHTYANSGTYTVMLSMYDSTGNCSVAYLDTVQVAVGSPSSCNASFTKAKDSTVAYGVVLYNTSSNLGSHVYTWDFGDGITGSGRTPIHQYQNFGSYVVCLTVVDTFFNCTSTFCDTVGMDSLGNLKSGFGLKVQNPLATNVNEVKDLNAVNVYPNPAKNEISLDLTSISNNVAVRILDVSGRLVAEKNNTVSGNIEKLNISNLTSGVYFVTISDGVLQVTKKFIKD